MSKYHNFESLSWIAISKWVGMKIVEYMLCSAATAKSLESQANKLITEGWQPFGQFALWGLVEAPVLCQPMVKVRIRPVKKRSMPPLA